MSRLVNVQDPSELTGAVVEEGLPPFDPADVLRHAADEHWVVLNAADHVAARCSLWWRSTPADAGGRRLGYIGHYAANGPVAGLQLLAHASQRLREQGCPMAVGPIDGNTWRNYRFVIEDSGVPPFFLEPNNPPEFPRQFAQADFAPVAYYCSSVDSALDDPGPDVRAERAAARMTKLGVVFRALDPSRFPEELANIYQIVRSSFQSGFLYQPLSEPEFHALYEPIRRCIRSELVTIAMHGDQMVGFMFTLPDLLAARTGQPIDTAIVKTMAILPERRWAGLGSCLVTANRRVARDLGYRRMIHALMHESNRSRNISARYASVFRRYALFGKPL